MPAARTEVLEYSATVYTELGSLWILRPTAGAVHALHPPFSAFWGAGVLWATIILLEGDAVK